MTFIRLYRDDAPSPVTTTVASVVDAYLSFKDAQLNAQRITAPHVAKLRFYLGAFSDDYGALELSECRRGDLNSFLSKHPEYESPHSMHDAVGCVVAAFIWAEDEGIIDRCPYKRPKDLPACEPRLPIKAPEVQAILQNARHDGYRLTCVRFRLGVWFLWSTGCRTCEMYKLDWSHYDDERGVFELRSKTTRRTGQQRLIVLPTKCWRLIRYLWRWSGRKRHGIVFPNGRGRRWNRRTFGHLFRKHADHAGVRAEMTAYCLRHGFCCTQLERGTGERQLADVMGHTTTRQIAYYGRGVRTRVDYLRGSLEDR